MGSRLAGALALTPPRSVVVLGGGLAGMGTAYALARAGWRDVTVIERGPELGGLAGTFSMGEHFYPLAYHHVLHRDHTLLYFLDRIHALERVRWRRIRMLFRVKGQLYDLSSPADFVRFPMRSLDKLRFVSLMLRSFRKSDWSDWDGRSAAELVDAWAGQGVRETMFEPLTRLKFDLPCDAVSAAWLGKRLYFREGSAPLGYIPGCNWTKVLVDGVTALLAEQGVQVRLRTGAVRLHGANGRIEEVELDGGERLRADLFVSTLPTVVYRDMAVDATPGLDTIGYTAIVSVICATRQPVHPEFYWMNLLSLDCHACGLFLLNSLNPSIGAPGDAVLNFVTHLPSREAGLYPLGDDEVVARYRDDFRRIFGFELEPFWTRVHRLPFYSPVFVRGYRNPPMRSTTWRNVYFAGNFRTFPSIASTGTALGSGLETGRAILRDFGQDSGLVAAAKGFRPARMPRG